MSKERTEAEVEVKVRLDHFASDGSELIIL